jgi:hypothetical protein
MTVLVLRFVGRVNLVWKLDVKAAVLGLRDATDDNGGGMDTWMSDVNDDAELIAGH